jgi:GxxExxY protein
VDLDEITNRIIGAAISVHRELGPGLLEKAYNACLAVELTNRGLRFEWQLPITISYKGQQIDCAHRLDYLIEQCVVVELKAIIRHEPIFDAQLLTYMKLLHCNVGLLLNFNVHLMKQGIRRLVLDYPQRPPRPPR